MLKLIGTLFFIALCTSISALSAHAADISPRKFTVYAFVPWKEHMDNGHPTQSTRLTDYFFSLGIKPIKVVYENAYFTNGQPDPEKIKAIAAAAISNPEVPISFDTEFGNRFRPETVIPYVEEILQLYRGYGAKAPVGVYATAPQNTYGWKPSITSFDSLNAKYQKVAYSVDFLSPVLYNYNEDDTQAWIKAAQYNVEAAKAYHTGKPIIPYISPVVTLAKNNTAKNGTMVEPLSEEAMSRRLKTLYDLGASGCIIWASSQARTSDGQMPIFDAGSGWGKAVVDFVRTH